MAGHRIARPLPGWRCGRYTLKVEISQDKSTLLSYSDGNQETTGNSATSIRAHSIFVLMMGRGTKCSFLRHEPVKFPTLSWFPSSMRTSDQIIPGRAAA
jgi:hypothetical protein